MAHRRYFPAICEMTPPSHTTPQYCTVNQGHHITRCNKTMRINLIKVTTDRESGKDNENLTNLLRIEGLKGNYEGHGGVKNTN